MVISLSGYEECGSVRNRNECQDMMAWSVGRYIYRHVRIGAEWLARFQK